MAQPDQYFLGCSSGEQQRLQRQAEELAPQSNAMFDRMGISAGARAVEIGCGPRGCLDLLAQRVGPKGSVVGIEMSEQAVEVARRFVRDRGIANVEVRQGDGKATGLPRESYDLAAARFVLVNIPEPEKVIAEMVALVRSGGVVALEEVYWLVILDPPLPAWDRLREALEAHAKRNGIDLFVGRRVPRMLREAGLADVQVSPLVYPPGHSARAIPLQFARNLRDRIIDQGLISEAEFDDSIAPLKRHLENPATLFIPCLNVQVWGRKP